MLGVFKSKLVGYFTKCFALVKNSLFCNIHYLKLDIVQGGLEPGTGKILWEYNNWVCHISVPSAVDAGNNKVLVAGGYENGVVM